MVGLADAVHAEYPDQVGADVIKVMACSLLESEIDVTLVSGTRLAALHPSLQVTERTNCSYGLNPDFDHIATEAGMAISAIDDTLEVRAVERPDHPFFIATLYQPQRSSTPDHTHPLIDAFVATAVR